MGFYFDYHRLETVNKNPIHPIASSKNHINSKLFEKMREGVGFFSRVASAQNVKKTPTPWGFSRKIPVVTTRFSALDGALIF